MKLHLGVQAETEAVEWIVLGSLRLSSVMKRQFPRRNWEIACLQSSAFWQCCRVDRRTGLETGMLFFLSPWRQKLNEWTKAELHTHEQGHGFESETPFWTSFLASEEMTNLSNVLSTWCRLTRKAEAFVIPFPFLSSLASQMLISILIMFCVLSKWSAGKLMGSVHAARIMQCIRHDCSHRD